MAIAVCRWIPNDYTARLVPLTFTPGTEIRRFIEVSRIAIEPCSETGYWSMSLQHVSLIAGMHVANTRRSKGFKQGMLRARCRRGLPGRRCASGLGRMTAPGALCFPVCACQ